MANSNSSSGGVGLFTLLGIVFITLKLTGHIAWPWHWVLLPLWGPIAALLMVAVFCFAMVGLLKLIGR